MLDLEWKLKNEDWKMGVSDCLCDCVSKGKGRVRSCGCTTPRVTALQKFFFLFIVLLLSEPNRFNLVGV
jgi:hypothetical protein